MENKDNTDFFVMQNDGVRRRSKDINEVHEQLNMSRRDTVLDHDYRTDQHRADSLHLKPKMAINSDTEFSDSDDDEAMKVAKQALYAKEYIRKH